MKTAIRRESVETKGATDEQQPTKQVYRMFIPDARPAAPHEGRGAFWYRIWLGMRAARA